MGVPSRRDSYRRWSPSRKDQCFLFQNEIKGFLDTSIQKRCFKIMKINNFRDELTDVSAKKEALVETDKVNICQVLKQFDGTRPTDLD